MDQLVGGMVDFSTERRNKIRELAEKILLDIHDNTDGPVEAGIVIMLCKSSLEHYLGGEINVARVGIDFDSVESAGKFLKKKEAGEPGKWFVTKTQVLSACPQCNKVISGPLAICLELIDSDIQFLIGVNSEDDGVHLIYAMSLSKLLGGANFSTDKLSV